MLYESYDAAKKSGKKRFGGGRKYYDGKKRRISRASRLSPPRILSAPSSSRTRPSTRAGASFAGKLKFIVMEGSQLISYGTSDGAPITMLTGDFINSYSLMSGGKGAVPASPLSCLRRSTASFTTNYFSPTQYGRRRHRRHEIFPFRPPRSSLLCVVSFPSSSYNGAFTFSYTAYGADGVGYTGKIRITVTAGYTGAIRYTTNSLTPVTFNATDFHVRLYRRRGRSTTSIFSQPYASFGTL